MKTSITAIILTKNEEKNIKECIETVNFCSEIIVIDDNSTDNTVLIAKKLKVKVIEHDLNGNFSNQRNLGMEKATEEWVLFLDADERISSDLATEIYQQTSQFLTQVAGFRFKREDKLWGKNIKYGDVKDTFLVRLVRKGKGEWKGSVHEKLLVRGEIQTMKNVIYHYPHNSIKDFLSEIDYYSTLRAKEIVNKKITVHFLSIIIYPLGKFIYNYVFNMGFRDGTVGIIHALMMSFHSFLVRSKAWVLQNK